MGKEEGDSLVDQYLEGLFPRLRGVHYEITSPAQADYNCIAWAAGDDSRWWWPDEFYQYYWPDDAPRNSTLEAFIQAFRILGFEVCEGPALEADYEKVAIYASTDGAPTHAARQLPDGTWTSKLGQLQDIKHPELNHVSGTGYGRPILIMRRPRAGQDTEK